MCSMFYGCSSLSSLPDISEWNINDNANINEMFINCKNEIFSERIKRKFRL